LFPRGQAQPLRLKLFALERAGGYRHYDQASATADLRRACELGTTQACQILCR